MEGFQPLQEEDLLPKLLGLVIHRYVLEVYLQEDDIGGMVMDDLIYNREVELLLRDGVRVQF